jgi:hypothetical protein
MLNAKKILRTKFFYTSGSQLMKSCKKQFGGEEKWIALFRLIRRKNVAILLIHFELLTNVRINTWQHEV